MKDFFVTGAIGNPLAPPLFQKPDTRVTVLLRADSDEQLCARVLALRQFWGSEVTDDAALKRMRAVRGDTTLPRAGLSDADCRDVCDQITHIVHSAGNVRMNLPLNTGRRSAVGSAKHVLDLAWSGTCQESCVRRHEQAKSLLG